MCWTCSLPALRLHQGNRYWRFVTFNGWYHYKGYLEKDNLTPNILRYTSRIYSDGGYMGHSNGYLVFYGAGQFLMGLDPQLSNQTVRISGIMKEGSMIEISGRPDNSSTSVETILRVSAVPLSDNVMDLNSAFDENVETYATVKSDQNEINFDFEIIAYRTLESMNIELTRSNGYSAHLCVYVDGNDGTFEKIGKYRIYHNEDGLIDINYDGTFRHLKIKNCYGSSILMCHSYTYMK